MQLQPLRIPTGWTVAYNTFFDVDPTPEAVGSELTLFTQDLLQLRHDGADILIDLGWTPEGQFDDGAFHLQVYRTDFNGQRLFERRSQDKGRIIAEIERICGEIAQGTFGPIS